MRRIYSKILLFVVSAMLLCSCNGTKFIADDELLLTHNSITSSEDKINIGALTPYVAQQPNSKWFSLLKAPLGIYCMSGQDTTKVINRLFRKWGEAPVVLDTTLIEQSARNIRTAVMNDGYLDAQVVVNKNISEKRVKVNYNIIPNKKYVIRNVAYNITDHRIDSLMNEHGMKYPEYMKPSFDFSINNLEKERSRIAEWLNENGYLYFNKDAVTYFVDSCRNEGYVDVMLNIGLYRKSVSEQFRQNPYYRINNISYHSAPGQKLNLRHRLLDINTLIRSGETFKASDLQKTYNKFSKIQTIRSINIHFDELQDTFDIDGSRFVDANISITRKKPHNIIIQPEGTNTAGDLGAALSLTYENRNLFHGGEIFSLQARGAFEAIHGLEGYQRNNYQEYLVEGRLTFPEFLIPGVSRNFLRRHNASSEFHISYNWQNRPEFHRRVFSAGWRYRWQSASKRVGYLFDLINVDYLSMPWISDTFKHDYLDSTTNRNAILRYNYEDLLIMKIGFGVTYTYPSNVLKFNIETAGNLLQGISALSNASRNEMGQYKFARIAFAQYVKMDIDYTHLFKFDARNSLALHARLGIGVPYGNSDMLPFEKRYFSGGANSVRGWTVRQLGPGRYHSSDGRIDFINQTGDVKLDLNAEFRTDLFWKFQGALFIDAGNVWTIRNYKDQPDGLLTWKNFYEGIAVSYGVGLRLNFDFFILRLDLGMKAINPNYQTTEQHFPIAHHDFKRDYALHFAVGLPF